MLFVVEDRAPLNLETVLLTMQKIYHLKIMDVNEKRALRELTILS